MAMAYKVLVLFPLVRMALCLHYTLTQQKTSSLASNSTSVCDRPLETVILLTHEITPRILSTTQQWSEDVRRDCGLTVFVAWGGPEHIYKEVVQKLPRSVGHFYVSPENLQSALALGDDSLEAINASWSTLRHISVPVILQAFKPDVSSLWVFEYDAELPGSLSSFVRYYQTMAADFVSPMKICATHDCVARYTNSIVISEQDWRTEECTELDQRALAGPGGFVQVMRLSNQLVLRARESLADLRFCHIEKFFETLCTKFGLVSRTIAWQHHGGISLSWHEYGNFSSLDPQLMAQIASVPAQRVRLFHPVKFGEDYRALAKNMRSTYSLEQCSINATLERKPWPVTCIPPLHEECRRQAVFFHAEFRRPSVAECRNRCWVLNSSEPSLTCAPVSLQTTAQAMMSVFEVFWPWSSVTSVLR